MLKLYKGEKDPNPWYSEGLSFECTQCGQCCTGAPGYVWVTESEIDEMADFLNISRENFIKSYVRKIQNRFSLIEDPTTYDCIFLKDNKCSLYSARPIQCRTFPWWPHNLESEQTWQEAAKFCEGINPSAKIVPKDTIEIQLSLQEQNLKKI